MGNTSLSPCLHIPRHFWKNFMKSFDRNLASVWYVRFISSGKDSFGDSSGTSGDPSWVSSGGCACAALGQPVPGDPDTRLAGRMERGSTGGFCRGGTCSQVLSLRRCGSPRPLPRHHWSKDSKRLCSCFYAHLQITAPFLQGAHQC